MGFTVGQRVRIKRGIDAKLESDACRHPDGTRFLCGWDIITVNTIQENKVSYVTVMGTYWIRCEYIEPWSAAGTAVRIRDFNNCGDVRHPVEHRWCKIGDVITLVDICDDWGYWRDAYGVLQFLPMSSLEVVDETPLRDEELEMPF